jgi:hypothetical protein
MIQQITITTETPETLMPIVQVAIQNELKTLRHGIGRTREQLASFEQRFGMSSEDFARRFNAGEIEETLDTIEWLMEIEALRLLENDYNALREARFD